MMNFFGIKIDISNIFNKMMDFFGIKIDISNIFNLKLKNQANTNVLNWGGKLMAYFEAGLPHR